VISNSAMKTTLLTLTFGLVAASLLTGCLNLQFGSNTPGRSSQPTLGQQLMDLQKAKESGAITGAEYDAQKAQLLKSR
jgi:hypothetical protein